MSHEVQETAEEFDARYVAFFSRADIDGWEVRKVFNFLYTFQTYQGEKWILIDHELMLIQGMNNLIGMDLVPDPKIISAALRACRRLNDYALTIRFLEAIRFRANSANKDIYPYVLKVNNRKIT